MEDSNPLASFAEISRTVGYVDSFLPWLDDVSGLYVYCRLGRTFFSTLLDENAASHPALGDAYAVPVGNPADLPRINESEIHVDFMIGSDDVTVSGVTRGGDELPLLVGGAWQI